MGAALLFDNDLKLGERQPTDDELGTALAWGSTLAVKRCYRGPKLSREDAADLAQDICIDARSKVLGYRMVEGEPPKVPFHKYCYVACCFTLYDLMKQRNKSQMFLENCKDAEDALWMACINHSVARSERTLQYLAKAMLDVYRDRNHDAFECDVVSGEEIFKGL